jgi:hypothetical protein
MKTKKSIFMKIANRDLLVLLKDESMSSKAIELEVKNLNEILFDVESSDKFCLAHEIIDLNKFKIIRKRSQLLQAANEKDMKPFIFLNNLN